jgi:tetratricopeptide (TPR) repeat protein
MTDFCNNLEEANMAFRKAHQLEEAGEFEDALKIREELAIALPFSKKILLPLGKLYQILGKVEQAEVVFNDTIKHYPECELASKNLFHFLWNNDRRNEAMEELGRFQTISHSEDYMDIVREINEKSVDDTAK